MQGHEYYAHAFYQVSSDKLASYQELRMISLLFETYPKLMSTLLFDASKISELETWFFADVSKETASFIRILVEDGIIDQVMRIEKAVCDLLIIDEMWANCLVEVAQDITDETYQKIQEMVKKNYKGFIAFTLIKNPELKAGYRLFTNDSVLDLSVSGRLSRLVEEVNYG